MPSLVVVAASAQAPIRPLRDAVSVARETECLGIDALLPHLRVWLRRDEVEGRISVVVEEEGQGASFVVLHDGRPHAVRRFDRLPGACEDRRAALSLAIALAIDAAVLDRLGVTVEEAPIEAPPTVEPIPEPPIASRPSVRLELAMESQLLIEVLPEVAAGWLVGARMVLEGAFEVAVSGWVSSISSSALDPGRVDVQLAGARLDLCARRPIDVITLRGCVGAAGGAALGRGRDVPRERETTVAFVGALARVGLALAVTEWLALELALDGWVAILRPRFDLVLPPTGAVVQSASLPVGGGALALGLALRF
jgi:hypothetical protein